MLPQAEGIQGFIFIIRGSRVMLSKHLAALYNVEPRALVQAVKRNRERFPGDFMFQLTAAEWENLKSQIVISSWGGSRRATPYAFTEHGIAMLSSVLKSRRAIQVNIEIMRAFVRLFLNPVNDLNGAKRLNDWNDWNGLRYYKGPTWRRNTTHSSRLCSTRFASS